MKDRYEQLVADATSGVISRDDAYRLLAQLTVIDSAGCQWGLNDEGQFTRRRNPAEPPSVTNPGAFAPAAVPLQSYTSAVPQQVSMVSHEPMRVEDTTAPRIATPFERRSPERKGLKLEGAKELVSRRPATLVVVGLIAASLLLSAISERNTTATSSTTTAVAETVMAPEAVTPPSETDVQRVYAALTSDAQRAAGVIVGGIADPATLAQWNGFRVLGFQVRAEPMPQGVAAQRWLLVDSTGSPQLNFDVEWVSESGVWKLKAWPTQA